MNPKRLIVFALALALAVTACTAPTDQPGTGQSTAKDLGVRSSQWGFLHVYNPAGPPRWKRRVAQPEFPTKDGTTVLDLLVGADGAVMDASVVESCGDKAADDAARAMFVGAVFPVIPDYPDSEPYVVRTTVTLQGGAGMPPRSL